MAIWTIDLTTEDGALSAAQNGGAACFVAAVLTVLSLVVSGGLEWNLDRNMALGIAGFGLAETALYVVAGLRLRASRGLIWGSIAALLLLVEIVMHVVALAQLTAPGTVVGLAIDAILLIVVVNGLRAARILRRGTLGAGDTREIFS